MKNNYIIFWMANTVVFTVANSMSAQNSTLGQWNLEEISMTKWNTADGIPYKQVPGFNLGVTSFEAVDEKKIAFLSNATNEIIITDRNDGKVIKKFPVVFAPRDFVYDNGLFYVLDEQKVTVYDETGKYINKFIFPVSYLGIERLTRFNNSTYLLLPTGNSLKIEANGSSVAPNEYDGWITSSGIFVATKLNGDNSYSIKIITAEGKRYEKILSTDKKVAGVFVTGATGNRIILDVQKFISESPIAVERNIISVELNEKGLGNIVAGIRIPDCYYVLSNKDFHVSVNGSVLNMLTAPQGVFVFSLTEAKSEAVQEYPSSIVGAKYHFNDHLLKVDEK